jgi:Zn-finger protein
VFFGTANRRKAEEDGMWVWLCHDCHFGVHNGNNFAKEDLQRFAQECWEAEFGDREAFIQRYGRNYL